MRKYMAILAGAALLTATCATVAWATFGGTVDPATGLVWRMSDYFANIGSGTWDWTVNEAAAYSVTDTDGVTYSDWRLPTVNEMLTVDLTVLNSVARDSAGNLRGGGFFLNGTFYKHYMSGESGKGKDHAKAWQVAYPTTADRLNLDVTGTPFAYLVSKKASDYAIYVRP